MEYAVICVFLHFGDVLLVCGLEGLALGLGYFTGLTFADCYRMT